MAFARQQTRLRPMPRIHLLKTLRAALATRRERRALLQLPDHLLDDIGVSHRDAWSEGRRPFWELPVRHHW
ncbi:MAG: DUF1127 domain-containing protein [Maritimibacter harenae]|uniref:DUF1127 domain-containing protein n=1 Tax=Maritimibacter harenae TaxID=2606218 RepID=A0A845M9G9_9RHOB|nr:DUF1127 domain-containing protein [Maritimibacter harenae]MZR14413.1 DUF1127 domain-containing protein [Maritimibacter harenae]